MITERALAQRVGRALAKNGETMRKSRPGSQMDMKYGAYYSVDNSTNSMSRAWNDLEELGRELGVLKDYEALVR